MPFAGYKDFAACVAANQDKANPEAYCATIMRKVEKHSPGGQEHDQLSHDPTKTPGPGQYVGTPVTREGRGRGQKGKVTSQFKVGNRRYVRITWDDGSTNDIQVASLSLFEDTTTLVDDDQRRVSRDTAREEVGMAMYEGQSEGDAWADYYEVEKRTPGIARALRALAAAKRRNKRRMARGLKPIVQGKEVSPSSLKKSLLTRPGPFLIYKGNVYPTLAQLLADEEGELVFAAVGLTEEDPEPIDYGTYKTPDKKKKKPIEKHTPGGQEHDQLLHDWTKTPGPGGDGQPGQGKEGEQQGTATGTGQTTVPTGPTGEAPAKAQGVTRPQTLDAIIGQNKVRQRLGIMVESAKSRGTPLDHVLFTGPPGLGKTTFARALANEMGAKLKIITGPAIRNGEDLSKLLVSLEEGDILFIDEIHAMPAELQEMLYPAMEDFEFDARVKGHENSIRMKLPNFTLVGATTNPEDLKAPLRDRFGGREALDYYDAESLGTIATRTAKELGFDLSPEVAVAIGQRGRGTPRLVNTMVARVRDYALSKGMAPTTDLANEALTLWGIDSRGLTSEDRRVLSALREFGRPTGLSTVSQYVGVDPETLHKVIEPYLMRTGFIERRPGGRMITEDGLRHLEENASFEDETAAVTKHYGPGPHASGSEQSVHRPGAGGGGEDLKGSPQDGEPSAGKTRDNPIRTGDVQEAIAHLAAGRYVELAQPRQVSTLLEEMTKYVADAEAKGGQVPNLDLCKVSVRGTNIFCAEAKGISRLQMPQFKGEFEEGSIAGLTRNEKISGQEANTGPLFVRYLQSQGVSVSRGKEKASFLRASQSELVGKTVAGMAKSYREGTFDPSAEPIFISSDNYIIDGHHRWGAVVGVDLADNKAGDLDMNVIRLDIPILEALAQANEFTAQIGMRTKAAKHRPGGHDHNQMTHGVRGGATLPRIEAAGRAGGFTVDHRTGQSPSSGYAVALPGHERTLNLATSSRSTVASFIRQYRTDKWKTWEGVKGSKWGGWLELVNGTPHLFFDISIVSDSLEDAVALGRHYSQKAIYDLAESVEIRLDDGGKSLSDYTSKVSA